MRVGTSTQGTRSTHGSTRRLGAMAAGAALVTLLTLSACTTGSGAGPASTPVAGSQNSSPTTSDSSATQPASPTSRAPSTPETSSAVITASAVGGPDHANPAQPVSVAVTDGSLTDVSLTNAAGVKVAGRLSSDGASWRSAEDLGYAKTYQLTATATDSAGRTTVKRQSISTLAPGNMTMPYFNTINGSGLAEGATYGVGMVVALHFDESIPDKNAAEKALTVTTTPATEGAWYWTDDQNVHWRPKNYYTPGTKVTVAANVYGVDLGNGLYGQADQSTSFVIGQKRYSEANAATHQVKVYFDDKLVRTMPTSMGRGGYIENGKISLWTMPGVYTVITHENPAIMSSSSYGLPASSPYGYSGLVVPYATKISTDGIYLHELDSTVGEQGNSNVSHGCLNLNYDNAKWYFEHSRVGDLVQVVNSGGPTIKVWQGGDWSVPWSTWVRGGSK